MWTGSKTRKAKRLKTQKKKKEKVDGKKERNICQLFYKRAPLNTCQKQTCMLPMVVREPKAFLRLFCFRCCFVGNEAECTFSPKAHSFSKVACLRQTARAKAPWPLAHTMDRGSGTQYRLLRPSLHLMGTFSNCEKK